MILSCPSCKKRFLLDARLLGAGRRVKCGNCGHIWHQDPPPPESRAARPAAKGAAKPAPKPAAKPAAKPAPKPAAKPVPKPPPPPPPPPEPSPFDALDDQPGKPVFADDEMAAYSAMRDAEPETPRPIPKGSNLPVPFDERKARRGAILRWGGLTAAVVALGAGLFFGRPYILEAWPASAAAYDLIGLGPEAPGAGLAIPVDKTRVEVRDIEGAKLLFVTGEVTNTTESTRTVPDILATAYDAAGKELHSWRMQPSARRLFPGQTATFESRVPEKGGEAANIGFTMVAPEQPAPLGN